MTTSIVPGSLQAIATANNSSIAEAFVSADTIVIVDVSGSMEQRDVLARRASWEAGITTTYGASRYDQACVELAQLQQTLPGKIAVIAFSDDARFCPAGVPVFQGCGTDLAAALRFVHVADDCGIRFIVISDGFPNDADEALREARRFKSRIDTIYVGPEGGAGAAFLRRLAEASGGSTITSNQVKDLADNVRKLLAATSV